MAKLEVFEPLNLHNLYAKLVENLWDSFQVNHESFLWADFGHSYNFLQHFKKDKT